MTSINFEEAKSYPVTELVSADGFADWFRNYLSENVVNITFTKKDGTSRDMTCTRNFANVPADKQPKGTGATLTGDTIQVFDTSIQEWRSFNTTSLTNINW